jgi:hypothetical protein
MMPKNITLGIGAGLKTAPLHTTRNTRTHPPKNEDNSEEKREHTHKSINIYIYIYVCVCVCINDISTYASVKDVEIDAVRAQELKVLGDNVCLRQRHTNRKAVRLLSRQQTARGTTR